MENTPTISTPSQNVLKKKHGKYFTLTIVFAIVALLGISFGAFGIVMSEQANQKADTLSNELAQKDTALKQIEEKLGAQIEIETAMNDQEDDKMTNVSVSAAKDYIYIGEWGIKIKIPEALHSVSYVFDGGKDLLYVSGMVCGNDRCQYYPAFMENTVGHGSGLGALSRHHKSEAGSEIVVGENVSGKDEDSRGFGKVVYVDDEYFYAYEITNGFTGTESEMQWELESAGIVGDMLTSGISAF